MAILRLIVALSCAPLAFSLTLLAESTPGVIPIQWSTDSSAVYYEVYRATNSTFNDAELIGTNGPTSTNYLDDAAGFAVPYHYWVLAKQENGSSQPVVEAEGTQTNKLWQYNANGAVYGAPAIGPDGTIYIATGGSTIFGATTTPGKIIALDQNGTFLWDFAGPRSFLSTPAVSVAGNVYAINGDGEVYALTSTGSLKWKRRISPANSARFWRLSPTITGDNHIILPTPSAITAVDEDGAVVWSYNVRCSFPVSAVVGADGTIYSTPDSRQIYAFSRNGDFKWAFPSANSQSQLSTQLIVDGDNSLVFGFPYFGSSAVYQVAADGNSKGIFPCLGLSGTPVALETGEVIVPVQRPGINQLVVTTFSGIATSNSVPELSYDPLTMASDGTLFVSGRQNGVGIGPVLYSQSSTGEIRTNLYGRGALGPATFHPNGTLLAGSSAGKLYALNTDLDLRTNGWPTARADVRQSGNLAGPSPTPTTPLGFIATQGEFVGQVRLNWSGAEEFRYIEVWRSATTDPGDAVLIASNLVSTTYFDANAPGGTNYYFLRAINSAGISGMTEPVPGTVSSAASVKWIAPVGTHSGVPSLGYDGVVYVPGNDRSLRAYSDSGALLWTVPEVCYITDRPVVVGPNDLLHSWEGGEWVLMSTNGSVIDRVPIGAIGTGDLSVSGDGSVYVNRGELNAYSPELTLKWQGRSASGNAAAIAPDGNLYVPARLNFEAPRTIEAYSPIGSNLWSFATSAPVDSLALREEGVLAVADGLVAIGFDGVKQWSTNLPIIHEPIIGADGSIFAIAAETNFHALNPDGTVKWSYPVKATGSLVSKEGNVYLNVSGGVLALSATGQKLWTYASTNYIFPSTGLELSTAGSLYFSLGTNLVALNTFDQPSDDSWSTKHGNMQRTGQLRSSKAASIDLVSIEKLPTGTHRIQLKRVGGETMVLEASQDLTNWRELTNLLINGHEVVVDLPTNVEQSFFRLRSSSAGE